MKKKKQMKSSNVPEMDFGGFMKDLGKRWTETVLAPFEALSGQDIVDFKYDTKIGKALEKPLDAVNKATGSIMGQGAVMGLNMVAPGAGTALQTGAKAIGDSVPDKQKEVIKGTEVNLNKNPYGIPSFKLGGMLKKYNAPTHGNGGQLIDANGNPIDNSVNAAAEIEKKETSYKDFVFSDNLEAKKDKTYADESKRIARKYANKVDKLSAKTMEFQMKNLMNANQQHKEMVETQDVMKNGGVMKMPNGGNWNGLLDMWSDTQDSPLGGNYEVTDIDTSKVSTEPPVQSKFKFDPEMIGTALKGAGLVKSGIDALQPVEKEKLQLNPNANQVGNLMSNRNVNFAALMNENLYNRNAALESAKNTRSSNVNRALDTNIYTQSARNAMNTKLSEQQANNQLRGEEAQILNNLGMQEANERIRQQNIQSMNDATKRGFERSFFEDLSKVGDSVIDKGIYDKTMKNMQANYANEFQQNVQLLRDQGVNFTFMKDADKILDKLQKGETLSPTEWQTIISLNTEAKKVKQ